jgi:anti-anti-sigma factor
VSRCLAILDGVAVATFTQSVLGLEDVRRRLGELLTLLEESGGGELCVDLSTVELLTAGGIGGIVMLRRAVDAAGGRLTLTGVGGMVREVLRLCGLLEVLDVQALWAGMESAAV